MKRIAALLLCLLLLPGALAETYLVDYRPGYIEFSMPRSLLIRDDGTLVAGEQDYGYIFEITDPGTPESERRFSAMSLTEQAIDRYGDRVGLYAMIDAEGNRLTGFEYSSIYGDSESNLICFEKPNGNTGILQPDGAEVVEGLYRSLTPLGGGAWAALDNRVEAETEPLLRVNADGTVTETGLSGQVILAPADEGDPFVLSGEGEDFCLDADLKPCIGTRFSEVSGFEGGRAVASLLGSENYGVIDATGTFLLPPEYVSISMSRQDGGMLTLAVEPGARACVLFGDDMQAIARLDFQDTPGVADTSIYLDDHGFITVWLYDQDYNSTCLTYDSQGQLIPRGDDSGDLIDYITRSEGTPRVLVQEVRKGQGMTRYTLVDLEGKRRSEEYHSLSPALWLDGHGRYITSVYRTYLNEEGNEDFDWNSCRLGVVDENGETLLPSVYLELTVLDLDRFWVRDSHRSGMIDSAGHWYYTVDDYDQLMD